MASSKKRLGLSDFARTINTERKAINYFIRYYFPNGKITCPFCQHNEKIYKFKNGKTFECSECRKKFTCKKGTFMEGSKIPVKEWLIAIWLDVNSKKGISAHQLSREINVAPVTAWFMLKRIREGYRTVDLPKLAGTVVVDEMYGQGVYKYRHYNVRQKANGKIHDPNFINKVLILGIKEKSKGGQARYMVIPDRTKVTLTAAMIEHVDTTASIMTDEWEGYNNLKYIFNSHSIVTHKKKEYVNKEDSNLTTNEIERTWSLLRKFISGQCNNYCKKHISSYVAIFQYRINTTLLSDRDRFKLYIPYLKCNQSTRLKFKDFKRNPTPTSPSFNQINSASEGNDLPF